MSEGEKLAFNSWRAMIQRCTNPRHQSYHHYGARGIAVCERWRKFATFLSDMGPREKGYSIDRMDSSRDYEPGNCLWAAPGSQAIGKSNAVLITRDGMTRTVSEWARYLGVTRSRLFMRIYRGTPLDRALDGLDGVPGLHQSRQRKPKSPMKPDKPTEELSTSDALHAYHAHRGE